MPNNCFSDSDQSTPMPRGFSGGAEPLKVVRTIDGNSYYKETYSDYEGQSFQSDYNAHEPEKSEDDYLI